MPRNDIAVQPSAPTTRGPEAPTIHRVTSSSEPPLPTTFTVLTNLARLPKYPAGNATFGPPHLTATSKPISAARAYRLGSQDVEASAVTGSALLALVSYSNSAYGHINTDGTVKLAYQQDLAWVIAFPMDGSIDMSMGGPPRPPSHTMIVQPAKTGCFYISVVLATPGTLLTSGEQCDQD